MENFPNYITPELFESRHNRIREYLRSNNLGALIAYSIPPEHKWGQTGHVSYLSGWANHDRITDNLVVIPVEGDVSLLFTGLPYMFPQIKKDLFFLKDTQPGYYFSYTLIA